MKKLSILLALSLILSFLFVAGCSEEDNRRNEEQQDDNTVSTTPVSTTDANVEKSIQDRLDAGEEVLIGLCFQGLSDPFTLVQEQFLTAELSAIGFTTMTTESLSDVALQIQQIENFVEMGAVLIIAYPPDAESVKDTVIKAIDSGTMVTFVGLTTSDAGYEISGGSSVEWTELGENIGKMANAWVDLTYPDATDGEIHSALFKFSYFVQAGTMMDKLEQTLLENSKISVTYTEDNLITVDEGFNGAENAMTYDSNIRVLVSFQEGVAIGLSNYIISQSDLDPSQFGVFAQGTVDTSCEIVDASAANESVYRGVMLYGNPEENPAASSLRVAKALLLDGASAPYWEILQQYSYTSFDYTIE